MFLDKRNKRRSKCNTVWCPIDRWDETEWFYTGTTNKTRIKNKKGNVPLSGGDGGGVDGFVYCDGIISTQIDCWSRWLSSE